MTITRNAGNREAMFCQRKCQASGWGRKAVAVCLILALVPACQWNPAQLYIPLAYALTGLCIALLMSPTPTAAVVGVVVGCLLGAAVYNNSLKRPISERQKGIPGANR